MMDRDVVLRAAVVLSLAVILFMCWLYVFGRWKPRRAVEEIGAGQLSSDVEDPQEEEGTLAAARKGLDRSALEALPTFVYSSEALHLLREGSCRHEHDVVMVECPVCLSEFQEEERGRLLPNCRHQFHLECIDTWLLENGTCPLCRASCAADVAVKVQMQAEAEATIGAVGVQYPTNVLFWGNNGAALLTSSAPPPLTSSAASSLSVPIQIVTLQPPHLATSPSAPSPSPSPSSSSSSFSRLNPLIRLLTNSGGGRSHSCLKH